MAKLADQAAELRPMETQCGQLSDLSRQPALDGPQPGRSDEQNQRIAPHP
jgi:hypothetical protein